MENISNNKKTIFICFILILSMIVLLLISNFFSESKDKDYINKEEEITRYEANQYIPVYVTEENMVNKYLNDFKHLMLNDINQAYDNLNEEYRKKKFASIDNFINYVNEIEGALLYNLSVSKYVVRRINGYKYFDIYASDGNRYIIKENSIMNYEVYLDEYTVVID